MDSLQVEISWVNRHQLCNYSCHGTSCAPTVGTNPTVPPYRTCDEWPLYLPGRLSTRWFSVTWLSETRSPNLLSLPITSHVVFEDQMIWYRSFYADSVWREDFFDMNKKGTKMRIMTIHNSAGKMTTLGLFSFCQEPNPIRMLWSDVIYLGLFSTWLKKQLLG